jgi:hypothetical protein
MRALILSLAALLACDQPSSPSMCEEVESLDQGGQRIEPFSQPPAAWCNRDIDCAGAETALEGKPQSGDAWCLTFKNACAAPCEMGGLSCSEKYGVDLACSDVSGQSMCTR